LLLTVVATAGAKRQWRAIHVFRPEAAQAMSHAFDDVCAFLQIPNSANQARELIAKRIIELGRQGELEYDHLRDRVLQEATYRLDLQASGGASDEELRSRRSPACSRRPRRGGGLVRRGYA
jgi:hypothetical protein